MAKDSDIIRDEARAIYRIIRGVAAPMTINARPGYNPTILALIAIYKTTRDATSNPPVRGDFAAQFTDEELVWFYNRLNSDRQDEDSVNTNNVTELTLGQRRELLYTLYRYWNVSQTHGL